MAVHIVRRRAKDGTPCYHVRFRRGGRYYRPEHAGSFRRHKQARERADLVTSWLATGRDPKAELAALVEPVRAEALREIGPRYLVSRIDLDEKTERSQRSALERIYACACDRDPRQLTWHDCQEFYGHMLVGDEEQELKPLAAGTAKKYMNVLKMLLDFADCEPNQARDRRIKPPTVRAEEPNPPTAAQFETILDNVPDEWLLAFLMQEQTGMYLTEVLALTWGDADVGRHTFRLKVATVKAGMRREQERCRCPNG